MSTYQFNDQEILMTQGHMDELMEKFLQTGGDFGPEWFEEVIQTMLSKRDEKGRIISAAPSTFERNADQMADLVNWATRCVVDFFMKQKQRNEELMTRMSPLLNGSEV